MAILLGLSHARDRGLGLRHDAEERRHADRRATERSTRDRRRADRRRARLRSLLFTGLALALPHQLKQRPLPWVAASQTSRPRVSTSIDSITAVPPAKAYEHIIQEAAALYSVDPTLIRSIMRAESAFDPRENIMAGARLLRELLDQYGGNVLLAIASYNAGPTAVAHYGGVVPPFRETQGYVKRVTGLILDAHRTADEN